MKPRTQRVLVVVAWILAIIVAVGVGGAGVSKFVDRATWDHEFAGWGYALVWVPIIGAVEVVAAILILWPRTAFWGGGLCAGTMAGAFATRALHSEWGPAIVPLIIATESLFVAWVRRPVFVDRWLGPLGKRPAPESATSTA